MCPERQIYIEDCANYVNTFPAKRLQFEYYRKAKQKRGVVVLYQDNAGNQYISYSLCSKQDEFDRCIGLAKALEREDQICISKFEGNVYASCAKDATVPQSLVPLVRKMLDKAAYYATRNKNSIAP